MMTVYVMHRRERGKSDCVLMEVWNVRRRVFCGDGRVGIESGLYTTADGDDRCERRAQTDDDVLAAESQTTT